MSKLSAKRFLSNKGYGSGTNYTTGAVAVLMEQYATARLEAYKAEVRKAIEELEGTALSSVSHVAAANYQHREREAKQAIRKKADDIISHLTKKESDESK